MALSTVAEWSGSAIISNLVDKAYSYLDERMLPHDLASVLGRVRAALPKIAAVMVVAEPLKFKHRSSGVHYWLAELKEAFVAAEDVLDELKYWELADMVRERDQVSESSSSIVKSPKRKFTGSIIREDTLKRLRGAMEMLDLVAAGVGHFFPFSADVHGFAKPNNDPAYASSRETTYFSTGSEVFGRETEKAVIIDWLKKPASHGNISAFCIVGLGGLGKTTLAQLIFEEISKENYFDKTIWVCVSTDFNVEDITRKILEGLGETTNNGESLNDLQNSLKKSILSKKVFLILDDVWNDDKMCDWEKLFAPLKFLQQGSKILLTTRMKSVADMLARVLNVERETVLLGGLEEQELLGLFNKYAFHGYNPDNHKDMQNIGRDIVKKLRGSPLATKVIGSLLNSYMDFDCWKRILSYNSFINLEQAKDVADVLKLSYYHLPTYLQECFRFCCIFPQDYQFNKNELIKMWMAVGIIQQQPCQDNRPEDIGEYYFNQLLRGSFFEYSKSWEGERYVMHDLMHDLAQNVSTGECCRIECNDRPIIIPNTARHVYVHQSKIQQVSHLRNLHSLVIATSVEETGTDPDIFVFPKDLIMESLRLLKICGPKKCVLPKEISYLLHLRYLSIELDYEIDQSLKYLLSTSIFQLYHLQVLEFSTVGNKSSYSGIETTGITNLVCLRYLRLPKGIMQTIHGIHKLTSLQELTFFVGHKIGHCITELGTLTNLRHLSIKRIENIGDPAEAKSAYLLGKNNLMSLSLKWTSKSNPNNPEQIIDYLQPHPNLMELTIENYKGQKSPSWMEESCSYLSSLKLLSCPMLKIQLFSWQMPYLKILDIYNCVSLDKLPNMPLSLIEFRIHNVSLTSLPYLYQNLGNNNPTSLSLKSSLRVVEIIKCPNLISLDGFLQQGNLDFQSIEKIEVSNCKNLVRLPVGAFGKFVGIKELTIRDCPKLVAVDNHSNLLPVKLKYLVMEICGELDVPLLESASCLTTLTDLRINNCANISRIPSSENAFRSLNVLHICGCKMLVEHSSRKQAHGVNKESNSVHLKLSRLEIDNLSLLFIEPLRSLRSVSYLRVWYCSGMEALPEQWLLQNSSSLNWLSIRNASTLKSLPATMAMLTVLERLQIEKADLLEELPELPASLRELVIRGASSLKSLPDTMAMLTVLEWLEIRKADLLEELPELPASLKEKYIEGQGVTSQFGMFSRRYLSFTQV